MKCKYIYKNNIVFDSEIELDDYLIEKRKYESLYGDMVFSKEIKSPLLHTMKMIDTKVKGDASRLEEKFREARKKGTGYDGETSYEFKSPFIGVNKWLSQLRTEEGNRLFPEFTDAYWTERISVWTAPVQPDEVFYKEDGTGRYTKDEINVFFPGDTFQEKVQNARPLRKNPDFKKDEPTIMKVLMEQKWKKQNLIGQALHFIMETYFSEGTYQGNTFKVRELMNYPNDGLPSLKTYVQEKLSTEFKKELGKDWSEDLIPDSVLNSMLDYAEDVENVMKSKFGENCAFYPELKISGKVARTDQNINLMGVIDLLVVDEKTGQINIFDYKTSTKDYSEYNSAKKLAFYYQLATYGKLLHNYGLNYREATFGILPITLKGMEIENQEEAKLNPEDAKFIYNGVEFPDYIYKDITGEIFKRNLKNEQYIIGNLDDYLPDIIVKDLESDELIKKVTEQMSIWFPEYTKKVTSEEKIRQMIEDNGGFKKENGNFVFKIQGSYIKEFVSPIEKGEEALYMKIKKYYDNKQHTRKWMADGISKVLKDAQEMASKNNEKSLEGIDIQEFIKSFDTRFTEDPTGTLHWFKDNLMKYCNNDWEVINMPSLHQFGIILLRNRINKQQIDVIKMSNDYLRYNRHIGGKNRTLLTGAFASDMEEKSDGNSLMLEAVNGNIELIETMLVLNNLPTLFSGEYANGVIGHVNVLNSWSGTGVSATNEELLYCFKKLNKHSKLKTQDNISTGRVKFGIQWELFLNDFNHVMQLNQTFQLKNTEVFEKAQNILDDIIESDIDNKIIQLEKLIKEMEKNYSEVKDIKNNLELPQVRLYQQMLITLASLRGINFRQQLKDHDQWLEDKTYKMLGNGVQGSYIDNPGNLASDTLNLVTKQVMQGYQNVRYDMQEITATLRQKTENLKKHKQFGWIQKRTSNQTSLYENMTRYTDDGNLLFTYVDEVIDPVERDYLEYVLNIINKNRFGDFYSDEQLEQMKKNHDIQYYQVPLAKAEFETRAYGNKLLKSLGERLKNFSPSEAWKDFQESTQGLFDETNQEVDQSLIFEMTNMFDKGERATLRDRIDMISKRDKNYFETNLEILCLKHKFAYSTKEHIDKVFPTIKAAMAALAMQGYSQNKNFVQDREYLESYIKARIQNKSLKTDKGSQQTEQMVGKIKQAASFMALAFSPVQSLYQLIQGLWVDVSLIWRKPDGTAAFTFKNMYNAAKIVYRDMFHFTDEPTKCQLLNELWGINDMDMNTYAEKMKTERHGLFNLWDFAYKFTSRPDFYNRMTIIVAKMLEDGSWDAYEVKNGKLEYDWKKDKRFSLYATNNKSDLKEYNNQRGLYAAFAQQLEREGIKNKDGSMFKFGDPLPTGYTTLDIESMKDITDLIYGYYSHEKKSMIHATWLGSMYMQMRTYWSGKKNQYLAPGGVKLQGRWEQVYDPETKKPLFKKVDENGKVLFELTTEDTGVPAYQWKRQWQEGIFVTLRTLIFDYGINPEGWKKGWEATMYNDDDNIRRARQSNLKQFVADIGFYLFVGGFIGAFIFGNWDKELQKKAKEEGDAQLATMSTFLHILTASITQSASDFAWWSSIGGPMVQWSPFMLEFFSRFFNRWFSVIFGDKTIFDGITNSFSVGKQMGPLLNYIKTNLL